VYCYDMRIAWLLLTCQMASADWLQETRQQGAVLEAEHHWEQAGALYQSALTRLGPSGLLQDRFWLLTSLVEVSFEREEYGQARAWLKEAEGALRGIGQDAPERVRLLNAWGTLHLVEGNLTAAERDLSLAVATPESVAAPLDRAAALHNLAAVEMQTGRLAEATVHETKALAIWRQQLGDRHHYVMKAWISLSSLQGLCNDWRAAESSLQNALLIAETPEALANYAVVLEKLKRGREAREIRRRLHLQNSPSSPLADVKTMPYEAKRPGVRSR
jgi:tetratricopeptide (TPR) repeat protein